MLLNGTFVVRDARCGDYTVVDVVDGHPVYDCGGNCLYMDRDGIAGADAVRAAVIDAYLARPPVTVRHVLLVQCERDWYGQAEGIVEIAGNYLDEDGTVLGDHSDCWWTTWIIGADCLAVVTDGDDIRVAPGIELAAEDALVAVLCPRCGDAIGMDTMLDLNQAGVLRCGRCGLEVETESIPAEELGVPIRTADIPMRCIPGQEPAAEPEPEAGPEPQPERARPTVFAW